MKLFTLLLLLQDIDINEKLKKAPDDSYQTGVIIGTYLPFIILIALAYLFYYLAKRREENK